MELLGEPTNLEFFVKIRGKSVPRQTSAVLHICRVAWSCDLPRSVANDGNHAIQCGILVWVLRLAARKVATLPRTPSLICFPKEHCAVGVRPYSTYFLPPPRTFLACAWYF